MLEFFPSPLAPVEFDIPRPFTTMLDNGLNVVLFEDKRLPLVSYRLAFHSGDIPYFFANLKQLNRPWEAADRKLSETVSSYWANFAKTGNPNGKGLPNWPAFDAAQQATMELGEKIGSRPVAEKEKLAFFTQYFAKQLSSK